jgi:hypothetical protein
VSPLPLPQTSDFKFKFRFDKQIATSDPAGGSTYAWSTSANGSITRLCAVQPRMGGEAVTAQRLAGQQPILLFAFSDSGTRTIDTTWRAVEISTSRTYALKTAEDMEREGTLITFLAIAGAADS